MHHTNKQKTIKSQIRNKKYDRTFYPSIAWVSILSFQKYVCDKCGKQFTEKRNLTRPNRLRPIPAMCAGRGLRGQTTENDTRRSMINDNFSNVHIPRRHSRENVTWDDTCPTVTGTSMDQLRLDLPERDQGAPFAAQRNVRPFVNHLSKMNPKSCQKIRKPEYYI